MAQDANPPKAPAGDPSGIDEPHDVLAAEEFAMPARENRFPADPLGTTQPHDVLAAEEFGIPAPGATTDWEGGPASSPLRPVVALALGFALAVILLRRRLS
ncbi:MAG: hypothetical protein M3375_04665 [Actinomycetota bacterium]|nr:hypothetical protein [Actinomycetota bacterium]